MDFIEELKWRGMLHDITPGVEEALKSEKCTGYIGFDPTAPSFTIGNYVQIMVLTLFQKAGHRPIFLMGGATGRIGDPSGKDKERILKSYAELDKNLKFQEDQAKKLLNFKSGDNKAIMINNHDFYKDMTVLDFLRDVGKNLTVNYMLSKDSVKNRLETGLSFTEFSYQLLQAYDFLKLYSEQKCTIQMGGSDQWGNITAGTEFIRRNTEDGKAFAITTPLLTKSDGKKFGKSEDGNIWLDPKLTSPYKFYQFWLNVADADIINFYKIFSLHERVLMESNIAEAVSNPNRLKRILAEELTIRIHSHDAFDSAQKVSEILFNKKANREMLFSLTHEELSLISEEIPSYQIQMESKDDGMDIIGLLVQKAPIFKSNGDARRAINNNAISVNKSKVSSHNFVVSVEELIYNRYLMIENGKKNKIMILVS